MPYVHLTQPVKQKLNKFKMFMRDNEYHKSTIASYNIYVSKFLRSRYYDETKHDLKLQITEFLKNETLNASKTFKHCRAALHAYFKSLTGTSYPSDKKEKSISAIEDLLGGFEQFQKTIKHLVDTSATSETNQVRTFLNYIYQQSPDNFNVSNINATDIRNYFTGEAASKTWYKRKDSDIDTKFFQVPTFFPCKY